MSFEIHYLYAKCKLMGKEYYVPLEYKDAFIASSTRLEEKVKKLVLDEEIASHTIIKLFEAFEVTSKHKCIEVYGFIGDLIYWRLLYDRRYGLFN